MMLTTATTEADLMVPVRHARAALASKAVWVGETEDDVTPSETLLGLIHAVFEAEAVARVRHDIVQCLIGIEGQSPEYRAQAILSLFARLLANGADDQWSGRRNDARRSAFDAVRQEINDQRYKIVPAIARTQEG